MGFVNMDRSDIAMGKSLEVLRKIGRCEGATSFRWAISLFGIVFDHSFCSCDERGVEYDWDTNRHP